MSQNDKHEHFIRLAYAQAESARNNDEVPIGALLVHHDTGEIITQSGNVNRMHADPTAHAEIEVIRTACEKLGVQRLPEYDLYVTLEPCTMCAAAISFARINTLVFGASDPKGGGVLHGAKFYEQPTCHHRPEVHHGIMSDECGQILKDFFRSKR